MINNNKINTDSGIFKHDKGGMIVDPFDFIEPYERCKDVFQVFCFEVWREVVTNQDFGTVVRFSDGYCIKINEFWKDIKKVYHFGASLHRQSLDSPFSGKRQQTVDD